MLKGMKLSVKIPLLFGIAVLFTVAGIIVVVDINTTRTLTEAAYDNVAGTVTVNADVYQSSQKL